MVSRSPSQQFHRMEAIYQGYYSAVNQRKMICIGRNYHAHIAELNNTTPGSPLWFDKPMSTLLLPEETLNLQRDIHPDIHHEVEVGIVIGMQGRNIKSENAFKHVAGYFVGLDFTNRILQGVNKKSGADWVLAKGTNQFAAVSEYVHKSAVVDPSNIDVKLTINGETRQSSNTKMMIFDMPTMIADISKYQELREGDIIFTGTPEGVGAVKDGDNLVCTIRNGGDEIDLATLNIKVAYQ